MEEFLENIVKKCNDGVAKISRNTFRVKITATSYSLLISKLSEEFYVCKIEKCGKELDSLDSNDLTKLIKLAYMRIQILSSGENSIIRRKRLKVF